MYDDDKILTDLLEGKEKAFDAVFLKYSSAVFGFMYKNCRSVEDAKDLTQDAFVKFWRYKRNIAPGTSLKAYLFCTARSVLINHVRKNVSKKLLETLLNDREIKFAPESENPDREEELLNQIDNLAQNMPDKRKAVYRLRWIKGLSRKEIASELGISVITVDVHLRKAIDYLKSVAVKLHL